MLEEIISYLVQLYQPGYHFIKTITPHYPETTGTYDIPPAQYLTRESTGLAGASSVILMTQVALIAITYNLYAKNIPGLEDISLSTISEIQQFCVNTVICRFDKVNFKKLIWKKDEDKTFELRFTKVRASKSRDKIFFYFDYIIGDGKITGSWTAAYLVDKFKR